ncbi:MAG: AAA family ATPase [Butyrivibrio sp.]|nr:AAA family ATPase [Muribaculum sp.]MCM1552292.1 AAA family ATPase [Butyrivibrio sp.]
MTIKNIVLKNYRCFEDIEIDFHEKLTVIVGDNGSGKTSILEGVAVSLGTMFMGLDGQAGLSINKKDVRLKAYSMGESEDVQPQFPVEITAIGDIDGQEITWKRSLNGENGNTTVKDAKAMIDVAKSYQKRLRDGDATLVLPIIAYYGTGRLWDYHREKKTDTFKDNTKTNGYIDSLDGTANIKLMMNWFKKKTLQKIQKRSEGVREFKELLIVYQAMSKCYERITGYQNVDFSYNLDTNEIECCYIDEDGFRMNIPLSQMSDGYKSTISLIADIAYRMAVLNPQQGMNVIDNTDGVVLVDEVDLHLHPEWQHRILGDLQEIFPRVQFIVTTHAPAVISSAKSENLVILKDYEVMDANAEIYGNDVNSILKDIMGVSERNPVIAALFSQFYSLLNEGRYDEAEKILDEIDGQRDYHDKEVAADRVKLRLERIRGGQK